MINYSLQKYVSFKYIQYSYFVKNYTFVEPDLKFTWRCVLRSRASKMWHCMVWYTRTYFLHLQSGKIHAFLWFSELSALIPLNGVYFKVFAAHTHRFVCEIRVEVPHVIDLNFMSQVLKLSSNNSYIAGIKSSVIKCASSRTKSEDHKCEK